MSRTLRITEELVRAYSRRGNYHSDPGAARALGLPGLVAQGMQAAGPAYAELLEHWGEEFLARGTLDVRFVGPVYAGDTVDARVQFDGARATLDVENVSTGSAAVVGEAHLPERD